MSCNAFRYQPFNYITLQAHEIRVLRLEPGHGCEPLLCSLHHISSIRSLDHISSIRSLDHTSSNLNFRPFMLPSAQRFSRSSRDQQYHALSYVWGSELKPCALFCCPVQYAPGQSIELVPPTVIPITASLDSILRTFRENMPYAAEYLWIDAVCINQENLAERESQVLAMGDIYSRAKTTFVCLGEDDNDAAEAFQCVRKIQQIYGAFQYIHTLQQSLAEVGHRPWLLKKNHVGFIAEKSWRSFERLLSRPWFSRVWVFQEAVLSPEIRLLYNKSTLSWEELSEACQLVEDFQIAIETSRGQPLHLPVVTMNDANSWKLTRDDPGISPTPMSFIDMPNKWADEIYGFIPLDRLLMMMRGAQASDARDKVYALLSISSGFKRHLLTPDYSVNFQECYINTAKVLLDMRGLSPLAILSFTQHSDMSLSADLPSWCPDWRKPLYSPWLILYSGVTFLREIHGSAEVSISEGVYTLTVSGVTLMKIVGFQQARHSDNLNLLPTSITYPMTNESYATVVQKGLYAQDSTHASGEFNLPHHSFWAHHTQHKSTNYGASLLSQFYDYIATEPDIDIAAWDRANGVQGVAHGRRSFVTDLGFIGFGPAASTIGDEICFLFGGKVPFVIRREDNRSRFVGECFVLGIMDGEAIHDFDDSQIEKFVLY